MPPAKTLREAFNFLRPEEPVSAADPAGFYVPRPSGQGIERLQDWLEMDDNPSSKLLFTGHRGSGKSTELNRLAEAITDRYFVVTYSIESVLDILDIHYVDVLLSMAGQLLERARTAELKLNEKLVENLLLWSAERVKEWEDEGKLGGELGINIDKIVKVTASLGKSRTVRQQARQQIDPQLSDLIRHMDAIVADVKDKDGKDVLFIIDGIDKVSLPAARSMYVETNAMLLPSVKAVFTIPYAFIFTSDFGQVRTSFSAAEPFILPNIQARRKDGAPFKPGQGFMEEALLKRVDASLLSPGSIQRLVEFSGGVVREMIGLARDSCLRARNDHRIGEGHVLAAATQVQNNFERMLSLEDYRELWSVRQDHERNFTFSPPKERLIQTLALLLYLDENSKQWCDVNPLVLMLLEARRDAIERAAQPEA